ncbi:MAG: sigma-70 family RNA polymerase sigma factor [Spirochaetales bacterium]|nr:sigma-70 family RNA polymerase sigma factor [Spirochaetales bacterium]
MSSYDPFFWEIPVDPAVLDTLSSGQDDPLSALIKKLDQKETEEKNKNKQEVLAIIKDLIDTKLTEIQRKVVTLYFYQHKTQKDIACILGISQQAVSRHLFGVMRDGKKIGGAVRKLKKLCGELNITPEKWV